MSTERFHAFAAMIFLSVTSMSVAVDNFQLALDQAKGKIIRYRLARLSGDPIAIRDATIQLQEDPLAIRRVNSRSTDAFRNQLNQDIGAVQERTREGIRERFEKIGVSRDRVSFFEATNPTKPGDPVKVGQDWDMTLRIDGKDVPTRVSQPIAHEAYYEAATGNKPPPRGGSSPVAEHVARTQYREAANHFAERQSLAVTDYQYREAYGGSPTEGGRIITGLKDARLRDPVQMSMVIEYKSTEARNLAADLRKEGKLGSAVGRDIEEMRQSTKQFEKQVKPRVEAMGGTIHPHIAEGQAIMKRIDSGELTPAQAAEQLKAIGETPESMTRKSALLVEAAQTLQNPNKRGAPAQDVFVENVLNRLESRRLMRILDKVETGELTAAQAREQIQQLEAAKKKPSAGGAPVEPVESIGATTRRQANNALGVLWVLSTGGEAGAEEVRLAAQEGEDPGLARAAFSAVAEASLIPGIARSFKHGQEVGKEEMEKADKEGRSRSDAFLSGAGRIGRELSFWDLGTQIAEEEIADEEARAAAEGREPNYMTSWADATLYGLGEVLMINSIARSANSLTEEEVIQFGEEKIFRQWVQRNLNRDVHELIAIVRDLQQFLLDADLDDPDFADRLAALTARYDNARLAMANLADAAGRQLGEQDPFTRALRDKVGQLPNAPKAQDLIAARQEELIEVPQVVGRVFNSASGVIVAAGLMPQGADVAKKPDTVKPNVVFAQEPEAGKRVPWDTTVTFLYHSGKVTPKTVKVPDLAKLTKEEAEAKLAELKFDPKPKAGTEKPPRTAKKHEVYMQSPQAGTEAAEGDPVQFDYYAGIPIGRYVGMKKAEAEAAITKDGLKPIVHPGDLMAKTEAERQKVYEQKPAPGEFVWWDDPVDATYYRIENGFQDGDGNFVDPRFASAKVNDGSFPGSNEPSAGERTMIMFTSGAGSGGGEVAALKMLSWSIRKYTDAARPSEFIAMMQKDSFMTFKSASAPGVATLAKDRQVSPTMSIGTMDSSTPGQQLASHHAMIIYRDVFLISFSHNEPVFGYDFTKESAAILKKSKELIDERFPED
jgi:beta-lactam-binding protein with PASTA domain